MPTATGNPISAENANVPEHIAKDFDFYSLLKEEVDKSGELYLKVALWKVLLRFPQHYADLFSADSDSRESLKRMLVSMMGDSESLIREGAREGGLDEKKHGTTEKIVRENIQWLREKLVLLELKLTEERKSSILKAFSLGTP